MKDLSKAKSDEIMKYVALMLALALRPISLVQGLGFKNVPQYLSATDLDTGISCDRKNAIKEGIVKRFKTDQDGFPFDTIA